MKSSNENLKARGMADQDQIDEVSQYSYQQKINVLNDAEASIRSAAAVNLKLQVDQAADELLKRLAIEKKLYTRIAICDCLQFGDIGTARKMTGYLGRIGTNQHRSLDVKVSAKKCFPLARDIVARTLGRMDTKVFPALLEVLGSGEVQRIREVLDAIGYMVFYNQELVNDENYQAIVSMQAIEPSDDIVIRKMVLCLSAFPTEGSLNVLREYAGRNDVIGAEATRSIKLIQRRREEQ